MKNNEKNRGAEWAALVNGTTKVCGILADPVEHSMSPMLQNLYGNSTGTDMVYVPFRVKEEELEAAVRGAFALNIRGLNVTVPHKQSVMRFLDGIDETAKAVGAVNTLVRTEGGYKGYNTDVPGLLRAVREAGIEIRGRNCILIGAGGAAKAAAHLLAGEGAEHIYLLNRSMDRAASLADWINGQSGGRELVTALPVSEWRSIPDGRYLAIQSTSVGMYPNTDSAPIEDREFYRLIDEAVDIIYTPAETKFMRLVREAGGRAVNGLNMLIYQGVISYELWYPGQRVNRETLALARRLIEERLAGGRAGEPACEETVQNSRKGGNERNSLPSPILLIGFMGAGKTSVGKILAERTGLPFLDTDQEIEKRAGMTIPEIFETKGEEGFRAVETETLRALIEESEESPSPAVFSTGGGLPMREENRELLRQLGFCVYLKTSAGEVLCRLKGDTTRPLLRGDNVRERAEGLLKEREPFYEAASDCIVLTDQKTPEEIAEEIESKIREL